MQGDLGHLQESVWNLEYNRKGINGRNGISAATARRRTSASRSALRLPSSQSQTYEMKTCSTILQTVPLMKGSLSLCSPSTYNACNAAIISVHLQASLISRSCSLQPKLVATGELSSQGSYSALLGSINKARVSKPPGKILRIWRSKMLEWFDGMMMLIRGFDSHWLE